MDKEYIEQELRTETEYQEYKEWEESGSDDDFNTWKLKKYINERFIFTVVIAIIVIFILLKII